MGTHTPVGDAQPAGKHRSRALRFEDPEPARTLSVQERVKFEDAEFQDAEFQDAEFQDAEFQDPEVQDPEVQDPEVQDPEFEDAAPSSGSVRPWLPSALANIGLTVPGWRVPLRSALGWVRLDVVGR